MGFSIIDMLFDTPLICPNCNKWVGHDMEYKFKEYKRCTCPYCDWNIYDRWE